MTTHKAQPADPTEATTYVKCVCGRWIRRWYVRGKNDWRHEKGM